MRFIANGIFIVLASASLSAMAAERETETFSYELAEDGRLSLENVNGDVNITGGPGDKVEITAEKRADNSKDLARLQVKITANAASIQIETAHEKSGSRWFNNNSGEVTYTLIVPASVNLDAISTVNGDVTVAGVSGTVDVQSVNGDIELENLVDNADLETTNGGIVASFERMQGSQRVDADTVNGRITLHLPADSSARVRAETLNGSIDARDFGLEADEGGFVGKDLSGTIGTGEARIDLDTVNGGIRIRKQGS